MEEALVAEVVQEEVEGVDWVVAQDMVEGLDSARPKKP